MSDNDIVERLDIIISLLTPKFDTQNYDIKGLRLEVIKLCDGDHSVNDMIKKLKKSRQVIDNALSFLRSKGLIKSITKGGNIFYIRLK